MQGYSRTTYIATISNGNSAVLQFRPNDLHDKEYSKTARMHIGDLAPLARLLTEHEISLLVCEISRIGRFSFCELRKVPNSVRLFPTITEGLGFFTWEILYGELKLQDKRRVTSVIEEMAKAAQTKNPLLLSFKADFATIEERMQSRTLDDPPLSISDGDFESNISHGDRARNGYRLSRLGDDASLAVRV